MLQKVLVVVVGLVMSLIGALSPDNFVASQTQDQAAALSGNVADELLATIRATDGQAFARIPVLWVEVDGHRVTEDAWGSGGIDEMRFKVGVKGVDGVALRAGETDVALRPTDVITVRMFRGDFAYRGMGTNLASIQLQGTVKTTTLHEGELTNKVRTQTDGFDLQAKTTAQPTVPEDGRVAYVVLTTGQRVDTLAVEDGGGRLFTEEAATADAARGEPGNLLAKWVKIDGKLVREYTWGDGPLSRIEFEPAEGAERSVVVAFNDAPAEFVAGERVVVADYVGEYLVYQVAGGMMRLRLDGYAASTSTASTASPLPIQVGAGAPIPRIEMFPRNPRTTDTVRFNDTSGDDGVIVFRQWNFGDNSTSVIPNPTHRFLKPGPYTINLTVTDNDLQTSTVLEEIIVRNAPPVPDFDFAPKVVTTDTIVAFTDHSFDTDGSIVNWTWNFGDGDVSHTRHPTHQFGRGGSITVTLTTIDDAGERASLSKVVIVRNNPPLAAFNFSPEQPRTGDIIQFNASASSDTDGEIVSWNWTFGDGTTGSGSVPPKIYPRPGVFSVSLTVTDDAGDADTLTTQLVVRPRPPNADFTWSPAGAPAQTPVLFTSTSTDPDGPILATMWDFGDGSPPTLGAAATHQFPRAGTYAVTLTVTDSTLMTSTVTRSVAIANGAPSVNFVATPNPTFRGTAVALTDASRDPDGDAIVSRAWEINGTSVSDAAAFAYNFTQLGDIPVTLTVQDSQGNTAFATRTVRVLNRPPLVTMTMEPAAPIAGDTVWLNATGTDFDSPGSMTYIWDFGDGDGDAGQNVTHVFGRGEYTPRVVAQDSEGAQSVPASLRTRVDYALPTVSFTWDPAFPQVGRQVNFTDGSSSVNGAIRQWSWSFGDASGPGSVSSHSNPTHVYSTSGVYIVSLAVTDARDRVGVLEKAILVNSPPEARFSLSPTGTIPLGGTVLFTDQSVDPDNNITDYYWDFGDGGNSTDRHPSHRFNKPGPFQVTLTVKDEYGATHTSLPKLISVANNPPFARWRLSDDDAITTGSAVTFIGGESSFDPDGTPLTAYSWDFGDNTGKVATANASHIFPRSGRFEVGLTVNDGALQSRRDEFSHRQLRVQPSHPILLSIDGILPNGQPADLLGIDYDLEVRIPDPKLPPAIFTRDDFVRNGNAIEVNIPETAWVHGDIMTVALRATFLAQPQEQVVALRDETGTDTPVRVRFNVRVPITGALTPDPGANPFVLDDVLGPPGEFGTDNAPLYTNPLERFHGTGVLAFADGAPAENVNVAIEARWVPLKAASGLRNSTSLSESSVSLLHWCVAGSAKSLSGGNFEWELDGSSTCYLNGVSLYPVGRWEVRARPLSPLTDNKLSPPRAIYVDPTGGLLLSSTLGLA